MAILAVKKRTRQRVLRPGVVAQDVDIENIFNLTVLVLVLAVLLLFLARKGKCVKKKIINFTLTLPFRHTRPC